LLGRRDAVLVIIVIESVMIIIALVIIELGIDIRLLLGGREAATAGGAAAHTHAQTLSLLQAFCLLKCLA
jgi:hypothetical protein